MALLHETLGPGAELDLHGTRPFAVELEPDAAYRPAADVLADAPRRERLLDAIAAEAATERRDIAATFAAQAHAWSVAAPMVAALLLAGRVPVLDVEAAMLADVEATRGPRVGARPGAAVVAGAGAEDALWAALASHLAVLAPALSAATGRPEKALWRVAHDSAAQAFTVVGELTGRRDEAHAAWTRAAARAPGPLQGRARPVTLDVAGTPEVVLLRAGCCLAYRCAAYGEPCVGCPLTPDDERAARLAALR